MNIHHKERKERIEHKETTIVCAPCDLCGKICVFYFKVSSAWEGGWDGGFPHNGKNIREFSTQWKECFHSVENRGSRNEPQINASGASLPGATNIPSFDAAGNVTQLVAMAMGQTFTTRYGYDFNNRLVSVSRLRNAPDGSTVTTAVTQLEYDGQGLLLRITDNGTVRRFVRDRTDPLARPILEMGATTNVVRWFVWANAEGVSPCIVAS